jgi:L-asparaginase
MKKSKIIRYRNRRLCCFDQNGKIAVATSPEVKDLKFGRISDSATVAGNYANAFCGVSLTGVGEDIMSNATFTKIVTRVTDGFFRRSFC